MNLTAAHSCAWLPALPRRRPRSRLAWSQAYPTRPVRMIVPFAPGGQNDAIGRVIAQKLSETFRQAIRHRERGRRRRRRGHHPRRASRA